MQAPAELGIPERRRCTGGPQRSMPDSYAYSSPQPNVVGSSTLRVLSPRFWLLLLASGAGAGLAAGLLMRLLRAVQHLAWPYRPGDDFLGAVSSAIPLRLLTVVAGAGLLVGLARLLLRREGGGHGSELAERIWFNAGDLPPIRTLVQAVLSIVTVAMGSSLGREAAPKQTGALIAGLLARCGGISGSQRRLLAACGAGAGIAAVYNVPLGGALFALEALLGTVSLSLVPPAFVATAVATAISWLLLPNEPTYAVPFYPLTASQTVCALCAGPLIRILAVLYVRLIAWMDGLRPQGHLTLLAPLVAFSVLGALALRYPQLLGNGKDLVQQVFLDKIAPSLLLTLLVCKPLMTAACLGSGGPGGLFTPTLAVGALLGGVLGHLWQQLWPGSPAAAFALMGAAAMLAASMQAPMSAIVLVVELTRRLDTLLVPVILATAGAIVVARRLESRSIYSARIHAGRAVALPDTAQAVTVSAAARLPELQAALLRTPAENPAVRVVDREGRLLGEVVRNAVLAPAARAMPLETATAADFAQTAIEVAPRE